MSREDVFLVVIAAVIALGAVGFWLYGTIDQIDEDELERYGWPPFRWTRARRRADRARRQAELDEDA